MITESCVLIRLKSCSCGVTSMSALATHKMKLKKQLGKQIPWILTFES